MEGRSTGWGSLLGVLDAPGTLKRLFEKLSGKRRHMTGTPPLLSAVEAMMGKAGAMNIRSKIPSVIATARFVSLEMPDRDSRISFMAASLQCLRGTTRGGFGSAPLAGGICIRMLFNKNPADTLELGERCLLAASFKSQIRIAAPGASLPARKRMQASLDKVKARTPGCINRLAKNDREARQAHLFVDLYELPADLRAPAMARTAPGLDIPFADTVDLSSAGEISTLTVNGEDQRALDEVLRSQLPELDRKLARGLCFSPACRGRVLLCNQKFGDLQNPGGDRGVAHCRDGLGLEAAEFSVKKSRNLPFINAMRGNADQLRLLLSGLNWSFDAAAGDDELVVGSVLGYGATATMAQHMQLMAAIYRGAQGNPPQVRELSFLEKDMQAGAMLDLQALGYSQSGILKAGRLLSAPLEPGGTLQRIVFK